MNKTKERELPEREDQPEMTVEVEIPEQTARCVFCPNHVPLTTDNLVGQICPECREKLLGELEDAGILQDYVKEQGVLDEICKVSCERPRTPPARLPKRPP